MRNFIQCALVTALGCALSANAAAAQTARILYHETLRPEVHQSAGHTRGMQFDAYGRHFSLQLQSNTAIARAVPPGRTDIEPLRGTVAGLANSWVRLTHSRSGWRGVVFDGTELYGIETAADVADSVVQPLAVSAQAPVIYRLKDALLPPGSQYCGVTDSVAPVSEQTLFEKVVRDSTSAGTSDSLLALTVGVVGDYEFYQLFSDDPDGIVIARMDIVDGIFSSQVGVKMVLAPITVLTTPDEPFTLTAPTDLLAQVRQYRADHAEQLQSGVTHLMTGRDLDGSVVGTSYIGTVCNGNLADSLSEAHQSNLLSALIAAHELGHNFNAPHDGEEGSACQSTPQVYLMAPQINYSQQFSACSLAIIKARIATASCLTPYVVPDLEVQTSTAAVSSAINVPFNLSFTVNAAGDGTSTAVATQTNLPAWLTVQSASVANGTCAINGSTVSCSLGDLPSPSIRQVEMTLVSATPGSATAMLTASSSNDTVSTNNSGQVSIQVTSAPTTASAGTSASATPAAGGSGGGGRLDSAILCLLGLLAGATARRRQTLA